jgi:hypothetical protein
MWWPNFFASGRIFLLINVQFSWQHCPAAWWEETAKPACRLFCINFNRQIAHREKAFFLQRALQNALQDAGWHGVGILKRRLSELADYNVQGAAV